MADRQAANRIHPGYEVGAKRRGMSLHQLGVDLQTDISHIYDKNIDRIKASVL
jgi:hypothetical protein